MKRIDATVIRETGYIALVSIILSMLMQAVFLITGKWDYTVLLGNLLGIFGATGNFFLMGLGVQKALGKDESEAKNIMKLSQSGRLFGLFAVALIGYLVPVFNIVAVVIPFIFPRIAVALRPVLNKD